jgi:Uncharacterized protein conserved in bacteria (DUF2321)
MFQISEVVTGSGASARTRICHYAKSPFRYGEELDALLRACGDVQVEPWNDEAAIRLIRLAGSIMSYYDTIPGSSDESARLDRMDALVRIVRSDLGEAEANKVAALVSDLTSDTPKAESAALKLKPILLRLGKVSYDVAIRIISDVASETVKKMFHL